MFVPAMIRRIAVLSALFGLGPSEGEAEEHRSWRNVIQNVAHRFGYHIARDPVENTLQHDLNAVFGRREINCVLDVGAHRGEYGLMLRELGFRGHIISFEPVPENFAVLAQHAAADPKWHVNQLALGSTPGVTAMHVMDGTTFSSFLAPGQYARDEFGSKVDIRRDEQVRVERLDRILDGITADVPAPVIFLKVDTQGYDWEVIKGAGDRLDEIQGVQTELSVKPIYEGSVDLPESVIRLSEWGFDIVGLYPVTRDHNFSVIEYDCLAQKRSA